MFSHLLMTEVSKIIRWRREQHSTKSDLDPENNRQMDVVLGTVPEGIHEIPEDIRLESSRHQSQRDSSR